MLVLKLRPWRRGHENWYRQHIMPEGTKQPYVHFSSSRQGSALPRWGVCDITAAGKLVGSEGMISGRHESMTLNLDSQPFGVCYL
jgi:hypothetical protein